MEQQWFQIALKTYFWVGFASAFFCVTGMACLAATKYYHDQGYQRYLDLNQEHRSYEKEVREARLQLNESRKLLYTIQEMRRELESLKFKDQPLNSI
jgi:hypothetical protein